jgi:probable rRNA maturation factor
VSLAGRHAPVSRANVIRAIDLVRASVKIRCDLSLSFVGPARMRALNAKWKRADRVTDAIAFSWVGPRGRLVGDVYLCRAAAQANARAYQVPLKEELLRLVIHAMLHVLGFDHPEGERRVRSAMWRRQERLLAWLI